jgi:hypothetical protein
VGWALIESLTHAKQAIGRVFSEIGSKEGRSDSLSFRVEGVEGLSVHLKQRICLGNPVRKIRNGLKFEWVGNR